MELRVSLQKRVRARNGRRGEPRGLRLRVNAAADRRYLTAPGIPLRGSQLILFVFNERSGGDHTNHLGQMWWLMLFQVTCGRMFARCP